MHSGESDEIAPSPAAPFACHSASSTRDVDGFAEPIVVDADADDEALAASCGWSLPFEKNITEVAAV